jgi:hypothetical protein
MIQSDVLTVRTDGAGNCTTYSTRPIDGTLASVHVTLGGITAGAMFVLTADDDAIPLLTVSPMTDGDWDPRQTAVGTTGSAIAGSFVALPITGRVRCDVTGGGPANIGTVRLTWEGPGVN